MIGLSDFSLHRSKLKAFVHAEANGSKGIRNVVCSVIAHTDQMKIPTHISSHYDLTTKVVPPDSNTVCLELNIMLDKCGGHSKNNDELRLALFLMLL